MRLEKDFSLRSVGSSRTGAEGSDVVEIHDCEGAFVASFRNERIAELVCAALNAYDGDAYEFQLDGDSWTPMRPVPSAEPELASVEKYCTCPIT